MNLDFIVPDLISRLYKVSYIVYDSDNFLGHESYFGSILVPIKELQHVTILWLKLSFLAWQLKYFN